MKIINIIVISFAVFFLANLTQISIASGGRPHAVMSTQYLQEGSVKKVKVQKVKTKENLMGRRPIKKH